MAATTSVPATITLLDPDRERSRGFVRGGRADGRRVEHDEVGDSLLHGCPRSRRPRICAVDRSSCGPRPRAGARLVAHVLAEDAREAAVRPGAPACPRGTCASVPTMPTGWADERRKGLPPRPARDLADAEVLGEQEVADASSASCPVSSITSATVRLSQRRFSGRRKAPRRTSAQPSRLAYAAPRAGRSARSWSRMARSASRSMSGPGPPAWIHCGSWMSSRVHAHSEGYVSNVTSRPSARASSTSASSGRGRPGASRDGRSG